MSLLLLHKRTVKRQEFCLEIVQVTLKNIPATN